MKWYSISNQRILPKYKSSFGYFLMGSQKIEAFRFSTPHGMIYYTESPYAMFIPGKRVIVKDKIKLEQELRKAGVTNERKKIS